MEEPFSIDHLERFQKRALGIVGKVHFQLLEINFEVSRSAAWNLEHEVHEQLLRFFWRFFFQEFQVLDESFYSLNHEQWNFKWKDWIFHFFELENSSFLSESDFDKKSCF